MSSDLTYLVWSALLCLVQAVIAVLGALQIVGLPKLAGNRDDGPRRGNPLPGARRLCGRPYRGLAVAAHGRLGRVGHRPDDDRGPDTRALNTGSAPDFARNGGSHARPLTLRLRAKTYDPFPVGSAAWVTSRDRRTDLRRPRCRRTGHRLGLVEPHDHQYGCGHRGGDSHLPVGRQRDLPDAKPDRRQGPPLQTLQS